MEFSPYWDEGIQIDMLQRWVLVHSHLYYELNSSRVSDQAFDSNCVQLNNLKIQYPQAYKDSKYGYAMEDFDGSTGFGFVEKLDHKHKQTVMRDAHNLRRGVI